MTYHSKGDDMKKKIINDFPETTVAKIHAEEIIEIIRDLSDEHDTSIEFATRAMLISQIALLRKEIENTREFLRFTL